MPANRTRTLAAHLAAGVGAIALIAAGADHLDEYAVNRFSSVPTIGTLFLLNFISATAVGVGLLLPLGRLAKHFADRLRLLLALSGLGIAAASLVGLWISESSSLFGFTDYGLRPTIVIAIATEPAAVLALSAYLALSGFSVRAPELG